MALAPGTRLGAYEIVALIGSGGIGEVYRARDSRLNRDVAIKVLPADVAADHDRLARFEREAQVLASLNHRNVANIYGLEDSSGTPALVMELVEGPTLADRIVKGAIHDALPIAKQTAEGLEADVTPDGQRFLINGPPADPGPPMTVVLNWSEELKQRVPVK